MTSTWKHERFSKNGGVGAHGLRRTLSASGLKEAHRLGRELPQNSKDAVRSDNGKVTMTFQLRQITGKERDELIGLLALEQLKTRQELGFGQL